MNALVASVLFGARFFELERENEAVAGGDLVWRQLHVCVDGLWQTTPSKMHGVERLALVSKLFCDVQIIALRRENERLKLELFWKKYSADMLHRELYEFHSTCNLFRCWCVSCSANGRLYLDEDEAAHYAALPASQTLRCKPCNYKPWFVDLIHDMDMRVAYGVDYGLDSEHFRFFAVENWFWGYGSRLLNASSVDDPDLRKLEGMFDKLGYMTHLSYLDY
jgi:hypothetical protein